LGNIPEAYKPTLSLGNDEDAADVNEIAISWLQRNAHKDDWFLHINYWDPHNDYFEPKEWFKRAAEALGMRCDGVKPLSPADQEFGGVGQGGFVDPS
jgi:arylsulfatase A-like enzyme